MCDRAHWSDEETAIFIDLCLEQVRLGKRAGGSLKATTFQEVGVQFQKTFGKLLTPKQLRNKWETLKKVWEKWNWLERYAKSGIGWNGRLNTFEAPAEWWLAAEEEYKKTLTDSILVFRTQGLKYKESLDEMYRGIKGTNEKLWAPSSTAPPPEDSPEGSGDSDGDPRFIDSQDDFASLADDRDEGSSRPNRMHGEESSGKRKPSAAEVGKREGKRRYSRDDLTNDLGDLIATLQAKSSSNSMSICSDNEQRSMKTVMQEVWALPAVVENCQLGLDAVDVLMDPTKREVFMSCPTIKIKTKFLQREIERKRSCIDP